LQRSPSVMDGYSWDTPLLPLRLSIACTCTHNSKLTYCMADIIGCSLPNLTLPILNLWSTFLMMCSGQYLREMF
jgi:hypothetical protein